MKIQLCEYLKAAFPGRRWPGCTKAIRVCPFAGAPAPAEAWGPLSVPRRRLPRAVPDGV
jgi:hypothetical protein